MNNNFFNHNKMVLDIYNDNSDTCKQLIKYWNKNYDINWNELKRKYDK